VQAAAFPAPRRRQKAPDVDRFGSGGNSRNAQLLLDLVELRFVELH
jgi:hypothetical protein